LTDNEPEEEQLQESATTNVVDEPSILADGGVMEISLDDNEIQ
jgi:hypothetical protein